VDERAEAGVGAGEIAAHARGKGDGAARAQGDAGLAAFAAPGVDGGLAPGVEGHGREAADVAADAAAVAVAFLDLGDVAGEKFLGRGVLRVEQDVQVRGVHVEVADDLVFGQGGEGRGDRGFAGSALAA
jgi:hypothetical protein